MWLFFNLSIGYCDLLIIILAGTIWALSSRTTELGFAQPPTASILPEKVK
jgi:hypothetical protein